MKEPGKSGWGGVSTGPVLDDAAKSEVVSPDLSSIDPAGKGALSPEVAAAMTWARMKAPTLTQLLEFSLLFPQTTRGKQARQQYEEHVWAIALEEADQESALRRYLEDNPEGPYRQEAERRLIRLVEERAFVETCDEWARGHDPALFEDYLKRYPGNGHERVIKSWLARAEVEQQVEARLDEIQQQLASRPRNQAAISTLIDKCGQLEQNLKQACAGEPYPDEQIDLPIESPALLCRLKDLSCLARRRLVSVCWREAEGKLKPKHPLPARLKTLTAFRKRFPAVPQAESAWKRLRDEAWQWTREPKDPSTRLERLRWFQAQCPEDDRVKQARKTIIALLRDEVLRNPSSREKRQEYLKDRCEEAQALDRDHNAVQLERLHGLCLTAGGALGVVVACAFFIVVGMLRAVPTNAAPATLFFPWLGGSILLALAYALARCFLHRSPKEEHGPCALLLVPALLLLAGCLVLSVWIGLSNSSLYWWPMNCYAAFLVLLGVTLGDVYFRDCRDAAEQDGPMESIEYPAWCLPALVVVSLLSLAGNVGGTIYRGDPRVADRVLFADSRVPKLPADRPLLIATDTDMPPPWRKLGMHFTQTFAQWESAFYLLGWETSIVTARPFEAMGENPTPVTLFVHSGQIVFRLTFELIRKKKTVFWGAVHAGWTDPRRDHSHTLKKMEVMHRAVFVKQFGK